MGLIYYEQNQLTEAENSLRQACDLGINDSCTHPLLKPAEPNAVKEPASLPPQNGSQNHAPAPNQAPSQPAPRE